MRPLNFTKIVPLHISVPDGFPLGAVIGFDSSVEDGGVIYAILSSTMDVLRWIMDNNIPQSPQTIPYYRAPLYRGHDAILLHAFLCTELELDQVEGHREWLLENREYLKKALKEEE